MARNKQSCQLSFQWRDLIDIYREFGDNAQKCFDFINANYPVKFHCLGSKVKNKVVKFIPNGVYILYEDGHNEKFDGCNTQNGVRAIGISHDGHCFGIALKDAGEYKLVRDFTECPSESSTYIDSECKALIDWDYKIKTVTIKRYGSDIPLKQGEYIPTLPMLVLMGAYKDEINKVLKYVGGDEIKDERYWSSTEYSANYAWLMYMSNGNAYIVTKRNMSHVRPVSAFSL